MVVFVARTLPVDNSDLYELDGYEPIPSAIAVTTTIKSNYKNGVLTVKVEEDDLLKYKISRIEVSKKKADKLFQGDFEPKLFKGDDLIKGSIGDDMLYGYNGNDTIKGRNGEDSIFGGKGKDIVQGGNDADTLDGGKGKDHLNGGTGANTATGGGGKDAFHFDAALMPGNNTYITDFQRGKDVIELDKGAFKGVGPKGKLDASKFFYEDDYSGQKKAVIYDEDTGQLSYSKGGGDISNAIDFGGVTAGLLISHKDFLVV